MELDTLIKLYLAKVRRIFVITKKIGIFLKSISLILHKATVPFLFHNRKGTQPSLFSYMTC